MLNRLLGLRRTADHAIVETLYGEIVAAARHPVLYEAWGVPDTPLGRFEMIALHVFLVLRRLDEPDPSARALAQRLTDEFFTEVEHSLRELGIGDMGVPKRMKKLARMFYGRVEAYGSALEAGDRSALASALARNVRPEAADWPEADALALYAMDAAGTLAFGDLAALRAGRVSFPAPGAAG